MGGPAVAAAYSVAIPGVSSISGLFNGAILGASAIESLGGRVGGSPIIILAAAVPAFVGGYFAISLLFRAIARNRFHLFAFYLIPLGILVLVLSR